VHRRLFPFHARSIIAWAIRAGLLLAAIKKPEGRGERNGCRATELSADISPNLEIFPDGRLLEGSERV